MGCRAPNLLCRHPSDEIHMCRWRAGRWPRGLAAPTKPAPATPMHMLSLPASSVRVLPLPLLRMCCHCPARAHARASPDSLHRQCCNRGRQRKGSPSRWLAAPPMRLAPCRPFATVRLPIVLPPCSSWSSGAAACR